MNRFFAVFFLTTSFFYVNAIDIAITIDDHPLPSGNLFSCRDRTHALVEACDKHDVKAAFFCVGKWCQEDEQNLLTYLNDSGHFLANHSFSHFHSSELSCQEFELELQKTEKILEPYSLMKKWFRHPGLDRGNQKHWGGSRKKALALSDILKTNGYLEGYVTINTFDWHVDYSLQQALLKGKQVNYDNLKKMYVSLIKEWCDCFISLYKKVEVTHTLLLHANDLNALFLDDILNMIKESGWNLVSPERAFDGIERPKRAAGGPRSLDRKQIDKLIEASDIFSD